MVARVSYTLLCLLILALGDLRAAGASEPVPQNAVMEKRAPIAVGGTLASARPDLDVAAYDLPGPTTYPRGATDVPVLTFGLTARNATLEIDALGFAGDGTGNEAETVTGSRLYLDNNADGQLDAGDTLLGSPGQFAGDDGVLPSDMPYRWNALVAMATGRASLAVAAVDGKVYAIGGYNGADSASVERYDPITNSWTSKMPMPNPRRALSAAAVDGKIYAIGGFRDGPDQWLNAVEEYDPATDQWTAKAPLSASRDTAAAVAFDGKIYVIGGWNGSYLDSVDVYDPDGNSWTPKAPMPTPRRGLTAAVVDGKIYAIGGVGAGDEGLQIVEVYDPVANSWIAAASMANERRAPCAAVLGGIIYVAGGRDQSGVYLNTLEMYDPATETWTECASMPTRRSDLGAAAANGRIYVIGGESLAQEASAAVEEYDPVKDQWRPHLASALMPTARRSVGSVVLDGRLYAMGGRSATSDQLDVVEVYDLKTNSWQTRAPMPTARRGVATACVNGKIYAIGGRQIADVSVVEEYDPTTNTWTARAPMPTARWGAAAVLDGTIYVAGGHDNITAVEAYDPNTNTWSAKAPLLTPQLSLGLAAFNGKIYAFGGWEEGVAAFDTVQEYDPVSNTWRYRTPLPTARAAVTVAVFRDFIYVIGGYDPAVGHLSTVERYHPATDTWTRMPDMPTSRQATINGVFGDRALVVGGWNGTEFLDVVEEYNLRCNKWLPDPAPLPREVWRHAACQMNGKIYSMGGFSTAGGYSSDLHEYDPMVNKWTQRPSMSKERYGLAAVPVNGRIYAIGGYSATDGHLSIVEEFDPLADLWASKMPMPTTRAAFGAVEVDRLIHAIGGLNGPFLSLVETYSPATDTWTTGTSMPSTRYGFGAAAVGQRIYAVGGFDGSYLSTVEEYHPESDVWTPRTSVSVGRSALTAVALNGRVYAIGGANAPTENVLGTVEEYDPASDTWKILGSMPTPVFNHACATNRGSVYAMGGRTEEEAYTDLVQVFSPAGGMPLSLELPPDQERRFILAYDFSNAPGEVETYAAWLVSGTAVVQSATDLLLEIPCKVSSGAVVLSATPPLPLILDGILDPDAVLVSDATRYQLYAKIDTGRLYLAIVDTATGFQSGEWVYLCAGKQGVENNFAGIVDPASNSNYLYLDGSQVITVHPQTMGTGGGYLRYCPGTPYSTGLVGLMESGLFMGASTEVVEMTFPLADNGFDTTSLFGWGVVVNSSSPASMQGSAPASVDDDDAVDQIDEIALIDQTVEVLYWRNLSGSIGSETPSAVLR